jgi:hypothetical protein
MNEQTSLCNLSRLLDDASDPSKRHRTEVPDETEAQFATLTGSRPRSSACLTYTRSCRLGWICSPSPGTISRERGHESSV